MGGLPLAIELAAARVSTLTPREIADRLDHALSILGPGARDAPDRHQTLRATLDWSYALLLETEQAIFARMALFAGGCAVDAAEAVAGASLDTIQSLLSKSILTRSSSADGTTRFGMLEPVRQYAEERLMGTPDHGEFMSRHIRYYLELAATATASLKGRGRRVCLQQLDAESLNIWLALARALRCGDVHWALTRAVEFDDWWDDRGMWSEARAWLNDALNAAREPLPDTLRADVQQVLGRLQTDLGEFTDAMQSLGESLTLYRALDDQRGVARCLGFLSACNNHTGNVAVAQQLAADALLHARNTTDSRTVADALLICATTAQEFPIALAMAEEAAELYGQLGDLTSQATLWGNLADSALNRGSLDIAQELVERALELGAAANDVARIYDLSNYARVLLERGDHEAASEYFRQALEGCQTYGLRMLVCEPLTGVAAVASRAGDVDGAACLIGASASLHSGQSIGALERRQREQVIEQGRLQLGPDAWARAQATGARLAFEDAVTIGIATADRHARPGAATQIPG